MTLLLPLPLHYQSKLTSHVFSAIFSPAQLGTILALNSEIMKMTLGPNKYQHFQYKLTLPTAGKHLYIYGEPGPGQMVLRVPAEMHYPNLKSFLGKNEEVNGIRAIPLDPFIINSRGQLEYNQSVDSIKNTDSRGAVGIKVDGDVWRFFGDTCDITVKNINSTNLTFSLLVRGIFLLLLTNPRNSQQRCIGR
eukprot:TRINITY_DN135883_c0_g1_i1.p3 TRINITY_DN135883_c0_g1~~TRINITY_DN135883_c0_g1_i1.p3  ORF type:complete len:192 (-),score=5.35 TRINITY_DN135883_c0_g1_i1:676-1251(-)